MNDDHLIIFVKNPFISSLDKVQNDKKHLLPLFIELKAPIKGNKIKLEKKTKRN